MIQPIMDMGSDLSKAMEPLGQMVGKWIKVEAKRLGIKRRDYPYLTWVLTENKKNWPSMNGTQRVLAILAAKIARQTRAIPSPARGFDVPPGEVDEAIDTLIVNLGTWATRNVAANFVGLMTKMLAKYSPRIPAATDGRVSADNAPAWLMQEFAEQLAKNFRRWDHGNLVRALHDAIY